MRYVRLTILLCGLVWLCGCSTQLFGAEVVTSGYICCLNPYSNYNSAAFELSGVGFDVTGSFENPGGPFWGPGDCVHCLPGTSIPVSGSAGGDNFNPGTATIGNTYYPFMNWWDGYIETLGSDFYVTGPTILLTGPGTFRGTFSFRGSMCGTITGSETSCVVALPSLTGSGIVTVDVAPIVGSPYLIVTQADYTFAPEPASLLLFCSGLLTAALGIRRRWM